ncbi:hypothetical protein NGH84_11570 [Staphylococcus saprophyticus]|uniref:hypothetical protein n=1 Tax=Staphylococcus saprophyticus TaxID=29385 RepID=UPI002DB7C488|nr:hypothetical protein [Staphylococcus saprophyticus]MEB7998900.1 hypothetical protein [Staphylococcus saprophyticus]
MKIKTKKQFTLPQLIEWGFERGAHGVQFKSDRGKRVGFRYMGYFWTECEIDKDDTFTLEFEEEVTEDTEFEKLYYTTILSRIVESSCTTIQSSLKHIAVEPIAFYILNDDLTMTLIWRDGKLVE